MQLHTWTGGDGPPIVLLHGLFGSRENLGALARGLVETHTVHAMDLRNHGRSPHGEAMDYPTLASDVLATMDAHALDSAAILGHSLGGKVAMEIAVTAPGRVGSLVILDIAPVAYGRRHDAELDAMRDLDLDAIRSRGDADSALAPAIPNPAIRQFLLKNLVRDGDRFRWRIPLDTIAGQYPNIAAAPSPGRYDGPALFLRGGASPYIRDQHADPIHERFPGATIVTIEDTAHWLHVEAPETVASRVDRFLSDAARDAATG